MPNYKNFTIEYKNVVSESHDDPRQHDDLVSIFCMNKKYEIGDHHNYKYSDFNSMGEWKRQIMKDFDIAVIAPLYMYDHSGITISTEPFNCRFDSGQIGYVFITRENALKVFDKKRIGPKLRKQLETNLISTVKIYDDYLCGEVYECKITDPEGDEMETVRYLGYDEDMMYKDAVATIDNYLNNKNGV